MQILLVEDNLGDVMLAKEALKVAGQPTDEMKVIQDGAAAIEYLRTTATSPHESLPDLILLDVNLPLRNGKEVLRFIKKSSALLHIPVIMLSTSAAERDIRESYQAKANCYITKPLEFDSFVTVFQQILRFARIHYMPSYSV